MLSVEIGNCSPEQFEVGKERRVMEEDLRSGLVYSWVSLQSEGEASVYPSRVFGVTEHEPSGLLAVRFAILSTNLDQIRTSYSLFADGLYVAQRNGLPFTKYEADGEVTVEEGYFRKPGIEPLAEVIEIDPSLNQSDRNLAQAA